MDHWDRHAQNWRLMGPPLRPDPLDVRVFERVVANVPRTEEVLRGVLLGATEELVCMHWPEDSHLMVVDRSVAMLERLRTVAVPSPRAVVHRLGEWRTMAGCKSGVADIVLGDGCFTTLEAKDYPLVLEQIHRVLKPEGIFAHRYFLQHEPREESSEVLEHWPIGTRNTFHASKLRLLMSLQESFESGVWVAKAWQAWEQASVRDRVPAEDRELVSTLEAYAESEAIYSFPTTHELKQQLAPFFQVELVHVVKGYWLAERCPIVICSKKSL